MHASSVVKRENVHDLNKEFNAAVRVRGRPVAHPQYTWSTPLSISWSLNPLPPLCQRGSGLWVYEIRSGHVPQNLIPKFIFIKHYV